jgi:hypothetical protein
MCPIFATRQSYAPNVALYISFFKFKSNLLAKRAFLFNSPFEMAVLDLISRVHFATLVIMVEIFHIIQLFFICLNLYCGWLP